MVTDAEDSPRWKDHLDNREKKLNVLYEKMLEYEKRIEPENDWVVQVINGEKKKTFLGKEAKTLANEISPLLDVLAGNPELVRKQTIVSL